MTLEKETYRQLNFRDGELAFLSEKLPPVLGADTAYEQHPVSDCWVDEISGLVMCNHPAWRKETGTWARPIEHVRPGGLKQFRRDCERKAKADFSVDLDDCEDRIGGISS